MEEKETEQQNTSTEQPKVQQEQVSWLTKTSMTLWMKLFTVACTLVNVYVIQNVWNWHATKYLGVQPVSFAGVFVLIFLLKNLVLGRVWDFIRHTKRISYLRVGIWWDTSVKENMDFLVDNGAVYLLAWLLKQYGHML